MRSRNSGAHQGTTQAWELSSPHFSSGREGTHSTHSTHRQPASQGLQANRPVGLRTQNAHSLRRHARSLPKHSTRHRPPLLAQAAAALWWLGRRFGGSTSHSLHKNPSPSNTIHLPQGCPQPFSSALSTSRRAHKFKLSPATQQNTTSSGGGGTRQGVTAHARTAACTPNLTKKQLPAAEGGRQIPSPGEEHGSGRRDNTSSLEPGPDKTRRQHSVRETRPSLPAQGRQT